MDMQEQQPIRRPNPRRRKRSKLQIFKEAYLPVIILGLTVILILVFIIGSIVRGGSQGETKPQDSQSSTSTNSTQDTALMAQLTQEAKSLLAGAQEAAKNYDYAGALAILDTFSGEISEFPELSEAYNTYTAAESSLVEWSANQVPNLAFHMLIADPLRAFPDKDLGNSYQKNFITVSEFSAILQQLYDNGYILVGLDDLYTSSFSVSAGRDVFQEHTVFLPEGKKPLLLTEINASYYTYMIDSDNDGLADAGGDGFASRLCYDGNKFYNDIVHADGSAATGAYDMVPILEDFIAQHPDFSYRGARATIAFTGSDGILGYRTNSTRLDSTALDAEKASAAAVTQALQERGYHLACYTYNNIDYGTQSATQIQSDLQKWTNQVTSVIGQVDVLVFARDSDIGDESEYTGSKFTLLHNTGFRYFMGVSDAPWNQVNDLYVRHNRLMITGDHLKNHPDWFAGLFDAAAILDPARNG